MITCKEPLMITTYSLNENKADITSRNHRLDRALLGNNIDYFQPPRSLLFAGAEIPGAAFSSRTLVQQSGTHKSRVPQQFLSERREIKFA